MDENESVLRLYSDNLPQIVKRHGLSLKALEAMFGLSGGYFCRVASRQRTIGENLARQVSDALGESFDDLFEWTPESAALLQAWERGEIAAIRGPHAAFWSRVRPSEDCWEWLHFHSRFGYGVYTRLPPDTLAHRVSYRFHFGDIPEGLAVLHHCDNPACVRPEHLFLGTQLDNMSDCKSKGRIRWGTNYRYGEKNAMAKLTNQQASEIRARYKTGGTSYRSLAKDYGVTPSAIGLIVTNKTYKNTI